MSSANDIRRVLVMGGGIGGLAAAIAFARRGVEVQVAEARPEFRAHGVGLGQPANGLRALRALGVLDECLAAGFVFETLRLFDGQRRLIAEHRFLLGGEGVPSFGALPRGDLHRILCSAAQRAGVTVHMGTTATAFEDRGEQVVAQLSDGRIEAFDLVAAFDGIRSATRGELFGDDREPAYTGYAAWRLIVDRPPEVDAMEFYQGLGSKTGVMPLNERQMYLFHIRPEPGNPWQEPDRFVTSLRQRLEGYGAVAGAVRDALSEGDPITYSPIETVLLPLPWYRGRIALGGDAVHASPPHLTQGAAMAMEDALVLVEEVLSGRPIGDALESYGVRRFPRCHFVQRFSMDMLTAEQAIKTDGDLEAARRQIATHLPRRLASSDRVMNQVVFGAEVPA